jgi:hypothetical protein
MIPLPLFGTDLYLFEDVSSLEKENELTSFHLSRHAVFMGSSATEMVFSLIISLFLSAKKKSNNPIRPTLKFPIFADFKLLFQIC